MGLLHNANVPDDPADLDAQPLRFLSAYWTAWQTLAARAETELVARHGLDLRAFIALSYIQGAPLSPGDLAARLGVPRYEVSRVLERLSALGAITREGRPGNARFRVLDATPAGRERWAAALATVRDVAGPPLLALGDAELDRLTRALERLAVPPETP